MDQEPEVKSAAPGAPTPGKKRYSKPTCTSEKIFETTALACGKIGGQGGLCNAAPSAS